MKNNLPYVQGYKYLFGGKGRDPKDVLDFHVRMGTTPLIIRDEIQFLYFAFTGPNEFSKFYPENEKHLCHEVIPGWRSSKIYFDLDCKCQNEEEGNKKCAEVEAAINQFVTEYAPNAAIYKLSSSGKVNDNGKEYYKVSYHIIVDRKVDDYKVMKAIATYVQSLIIDPEAKKVLDMNVYKSNQSFRTPFSAKKGRILRPMGNYSREDCLVTWCINTLPLEVQYDSVLGQLISGVEITKVIPKTEKIITDSYINMMLGKIKSLIPEWSYREHKGKYIIFDRTADSPAYCDICNNHHDNDNIMRILIADNGTVFRSCIKTHKKYRVLIRAKNSIPKAVYYGNKEYKQIDIASKCEFKNSIIYNSNKMDTINIQPRTVYLRANMKMGKTKVMTDYINMFHCVVIISFRRTFTEDKMNVLRGNYFRSYNEIDGDIHLGYNPRVIVQLESLHRITHHVKPDLVIMDESESIIEQFSSDTMRNLMDVHSVFNWLVTSCDSLLAMDANLDLRTIAVLRYHRGTADEVFIHNTYQNFAGDVIKPVSRRVLDAKIIEAVKENKNIIIPTNNKKYAKTIHGLVCKHISAEKVLLITGETSEELKQMIFKDVNTHWKNIKLLSIRQRVLPVYHLQKNILIFYMHILQTQVQR